MFNQLTSAEPVKRGVLVLLGYMLMVANVLAGVTDLATKPISSSNKANVKPNIMLLMDTSPSMGFTHMPAGIEKSNSIEQPIGYKSYQCNSIYYNRNTKYVLPQNGDGSSLPLPSFNNARVDPFSLTDLTTVNLADSFQAFGTTTRELTGYPDPPQAAYYYLYSGSAATNYASAPCTQADTFEINTSGTAAAVAGTWTRVLVSTTSGQGSTLNELQNFAIWFSYYRTRLNMSKSSLSSAFAPLNDKYRVGMVTAQPGSPVSPAKFQPLADFSAGTGGVPGNKDLWYSKVFAQTPGGFSPMREGLARVGRYFGGQSVGSNAGINTGMGADPMQYACQRNYTFMTTDGYWNASAEPKGPVKLDGETLVGQQDGDLTDANGNTPRPMFDGGTNQRKVVTNQINNYSWAGCAGPDSLKTSTQNIAAVTGLVRSTYQFNVATSQTSQRTSTVSTQSTQTFKTTAVTNKITTQINQSTSSTSAITKQRLEATSQYFQYVTRLQETKTQTRRETLQNLLTSAQANVSTSQLFKRTERRIATEKQSTGNTSQSVVNTTQRTRSTSQTTTVTRVSTAQRLQSTSRIDQSVTQLRRSTSQIGIFDGETRVPASSCTPAPGIECRLLTSGPTPVAACTPQVATASTIPAWTTVTCETVVMSASAAVASCTPAAATAPLFQTTVCTPVNTSPTPVQTCTPAAANFSNSFTATVCTDNNFGPTVVASCAANPTSPATLGNNWVATTCTSQATTVLTGPTGASPASCPLGVTAPNLANGFTTTTCADNNTGPIGVQACSGPSATAAAGPGNSWTATTCNLTTTAVAPVQNCSGANAPQVAGSSNGWLTRNCTTATTDINTTASGCANLTATAPSWLGRSCRTDVVVAEQPVGSCVDTNGSAPPFDNIVCRPQNNGPTPAQTCTSGLATPSNSFVATTCTYPGSTNFTSQPSGTCTPGTIVATAGNQWRTRTCVANNTGPTIVDPGTCLADTAKSSANGFMETRCRQTSTSAVVTACTQSGPTLGNAWTRTTCNPFQDPSTFVAFCMVGTVNTSLGVTTTCGRNVTLPTPVATCIDQIGTLGNNWLNRTCTDNNTGPTLVATCSNAAATSTNSFVATTCATTPLSGPTAVASCTPVAATGPGFVATTCNTNTSVPTAVLPSSCVIAAASTSNSFTATSCPVTSTGPDAVSTASCADIPASSLNGFMATVCNKTVNPATATAACTNQTGTALNGWKTVLCTNANTPYVPVASCTNVAAALSNGFAATQCKTDTTGPTPAAGCTIEPASASNSYRSTTCPNVPTATTPVASCTSAPADSGNSFVATTCAASPSAGTRPVATCTDGGPTSTNNFLTTVCSANVTTSSVANSACTSTGPSTSNSFTGITCTAAPAEKVQVSTVSTSVTEALSNGNLAGSYGASSNTSALIDVTPPICYTTATKPPLPTTPQPTPPSGCAAWPCSVTTNFAAGGSSNSLADVAQYYYTTDIRPDFLNTDLLGQSTTTLVIGPGAPESDRALWQHMTTFVMGLGVSGALDFRDDYQSAATGSFAGVRSGTQNWPVWPDSSIDFANPANAGAYNDPRSIDDFWHTAVNGRGQFFSADKPQKVIDGVKAAITSINAAVGAGSGVAVSNNAPVTGDNAAYLSSFVSGVWTGDVTRTAINASGVTTTAVWSAQSKLDAQTSAACDNRNIYYRTAGNPALTPFTWNTRRCDAAGQPTGTASLGLTSIQQALFDSTEVASLSQYPAMTDGTLGSVNQRVTATGANLLNYLRGQRGFEGFTPNDASKLYRAREHVMGDIAASAIAVVKKPDSSYADSGYASFVSSNAARSTTLYVGSNAGMLHAIDAETGAEKWAFVPTAVMPEMYRLADTNYEVNHRFYVDGSPSVGDIYDLGATAWKTILVGGLNNGGKGYYALDVTDPDSPKALWEFNQSATCGGVGSTSDCDVGFSYGRPIITKLVNGTWVVLVTSGYNNVTNGGTGKGVLYVLNAATGAIINKTDTGLVGTTATPSGLRDVNNYVANGRLDNTTLRVYGGDLLGNVWRFDVNDLVAPAGREAMLVATAKDSLGTAQPISTRVQLAEIDGSTFIVAATGQLLGQSDTLTTQRQTVYGFKDTLAATGPLYSDLRTSLKPISLTRTGTTGNTSCTGSASICAGNTGWYLDLPETAERVNIDPLILAGTVIFASNVPVSGASTSCESGRSYLNAIDLLDGTGAIADGSASVFLFNQISVGSSFLIDSFSGSGGGGITSFGPGRTDVTVRGSEGGLRGTLVKFGSEAPLGRRVSWREIIRP